MKTCESSRVRFLVRIFQDIPVGSFSAVFQNSFGDSLDPDLREISKRYVVHYDYDSAFENATDNKLVMAESKQFLEFSIRKRFTNDFGERNMHIMVVII